MPQDEALNRTREIKARYEAKLLALPNVVGVGVGLKEKGGQFTNQIAIIVNVSEKKPLTNLPPNAVVPPEIEGTVTDVQQTGEMKAL